MTIYTIEQHLSTKLFIANKYSSWYVRLIARAQHRIIPHTYTERHHYIPVSMGGIDTVTLTAREHFIAHWLLTKMTIPIHRSKMCLALIMMKAESGNQIRYHTKITARVYSKLKTDFDRRGSNNPCYDHTIYDFYHAKTKAHVQMTQHALCKTYDLVSGNVSLLVNNKQKSVKGWRMTTHEPIIYHFFHSISNVSVHMTQYEFYKHYNLRRGDVGDLIRGRSQIALGWKIK